MNVKLHWPPKFLDPDPCAACGRPTSKWFRFVLRDGRPIHFHCQFKEAQ